jgi:hypothetical protein
MSGAATSSGIEYQQRVAALFLLYQYAQVDIAGLIGITGEHLVSEVWFESAAPIDDLQITSHNGRLICLNIKRSLSLSDDLESDFGSVIEQFIRAFAAKPAGNVFFCLATSSDSSGKILYDLRKLCEAIRLNDAGFQSNPLNKSEMDTLTRYKNVFEKHFKRLANREATESDFLNFSKRVFIASLEVEEGRPAHQAALLVLASKQFPRPDLIWSLLMKNAVYYASNRLSVNQAGIAAILDVFLTKGKETSESTIEKILNQAGFEQIFQGDILCGREVLIVKSIMAECDYNVIELFRFNDAGEKVVQFKNEKLILAPGEIEVEVLFRASTYKAVKRFVETNQKTFAEKKIAILPANDIDNVEDEPVVKAYRERCKHLMESVEDKAACLHCGKKTFKGDLLYVEVDEPDLPNVLGIVHAKCRRSLDRVIGEVQFDGEVKELPDFDLHAWVRALLRGQALIQGIKTSSGFSQPITHVAWSSDQEYDADYSYCVRMLLANGNHKYSYRRGKVERLSKDEAAMQVKVFALSIAKAKAANDPWCLTSKMHSFGPHSLLVGRKNEDEEIIEVLSTEVVPYSDLFGKLYNTNENYYAPVGLARDTESELPLCFNGIVPLISDPLKFNDFVTNWAEAGLGGSKLGLKIVKDDRDFDNLMRRVFGDGLVPVVDPLFNRNQQLVRGIVITHQEALMLAKAAEQRAGAPESKAPKDTS